MIFSKQKKVLSAFLALTMIGSMVAAVPFTASADSATTGVTYSVYQNAGWSAGANGVAAGHANKSLKVEAVKVASSESLTVSAFESGKWISATGTSITLGSANKKLAIEALKITAPTGYDVSYSVYENKGWHAGTDGAYVGNANKGYYVEALKISVTPIVAPSVKSVTAIADTTVAYGTATTAAIAKLPTTASVTLSDGTTKTGVAVTWAAPATYDATTAATYAFTGTLAAITGVTNTAAVTATANVIVSAAALNVTSVTAVSNNRVNVALSTALTAVNANLFTIKDASGTALAVTTATLSADGKTVNVTTAAQTANVLYTLTVSNTGYKFVGQAADTTKPTVSSAVATKNTQVQVTFSKSVDVNGLNIANYTIAGLSVLNAAYKVDADGNAVTTTVLLTTASQVQGTIYKVVVANVTDMSGNIVDSTANSSQFGGIPADTAKPTLTSAVALTNTSVKVLFNKAMDSTTSQNIANYTIAGLSVLKATISSDSTYVTLTTAAQTQGTIYKVVVANVADASGNVIDSTVSATSTYQFGGVPADTAKPTLTSAVALTNTSVKVQFNKAMDSTTSQNIANYTIAGLTITKAVLDSTTSAFVTLTTSAQTQGTIYKLVVANVADASNNVIDATVTATSTWQFGGMAADTTKPTVVSAVSSSNTTVVVTFSKIVDSTTASQAYNYYLGTSLGYATSVTKDTTTTDGTKWDLTTKAQTSTVYTLAVSGIADLSGNVIDSTLASSKVTFAGAAGAADTTKPTVTSAVALDRDTVVVTFSKAMGTLLASNFTFAVSSGTEVAPVIAAQTATAINVSSDKKTATLEFTDATAHMTSGVVYSVTVTGVNDSLGTNAIDTTSSHNVALFAGISSTNPAPTVTSAVLVNSSTLKISFSKPVKETGALAATDFALTTVQGTAFAVNTFSSAVMSSDNTSVTVYYNAPTFTAGSIYSVTVLPGKFADALGVVALSTSGTPAANVSSFAGISATTSTPKIASVIAIDVNTLLITFDQPVNQTTLATLATTDITGTGATVALVRADGTTGTQVKVFLSTSLTAGTVYTLTVAQAKIVNLNGNAMAATDNHAQFAGISTANAAPTVASVTRVDATHISVVFSETITGLKASGADFAITNGAVISGAAFDPNDTTDKTVILTLSTNPTPGVETLTIAPTSTIVDEASVGSVDKTASVAFAY